MKIVFMGTPDFAVPCLDAIVKSHHEVVGVITATDKLLGRGKKKWVKSAIKVYAEEHDLKVLQPKNLKAESFVEELRSLHADLQVVVAFRMLPEVVWNMPPKGSINLHGSLLPAFRGAAPINWAIINGASVTGLTTFKLKHEIDTGTIIFHESIIIQPEYTAGDLHDKLMHIGPALILRTLEAIEKDNVEYIDQNENRVSHAPKLYHENSEIDFSADSVSVRNFIHGMSPFPAAWMTYNDTKLKIFRVRVSDLESEHESGQIFKGKDKKTYLKLKDGALEILELQPAGKPKMTGVDFANGYLQD